jgi:hypothetical protein
MAISSVRQRSQANVSDNGVQDLNESFPCPNPNEGETSVKKFFFRKTKPNLCELQRMIVSLGLGETDANELLESAGYPKIGAYLAFAHLVNIDLNIIPTYDLRNLLTLSVHSFVLEIEPGKARDQLPTNRPHSLTDKQFEKLKTFIVSKILPLVQRQHYPSIAETMVKDVITPYPALDERNKELLILLINEVSRVDSFFSDKLHTNEKLIDKDRSMERFFQGAALNNIQVLDEAVTKVIEELHTNTRASHPTKFEILLDQFKHSAYRPIDMSVLGEALYGNDPRAERAIQFKISKLNTKLSSFGLQIERDTMYTLKLATRSPDRITDE